MLVCRNVDWFGFLDCCWTYYLEGEVMDVQKIKELALANGFSLKEQASGNMDLHSYVYEFANAIEQAAKAQAVPEGFVLMPLEIDDFDHPITKALEKGIVKDLSASVIYKAMIEAQEPTND